MAYLKEVEYKGKTYDLFDKEAREKIQNLLDIVNNMDRNKANQADFDNYKQSNEETLLKKVDKEENEKVIAELQNELAEKSKEIVELQIKNVTEKASNIVINDCSNYNIHNFTMFGNSTQNATPSSSSPVSIIDVQNPALEFEGKNLFNFDGVTFSKFKITDIIVDKDKKEVSFTSNNDNLSGFFIKNMFAEKGYKGNITTSLVVTTDSECQVHFMASSIEQGLKTIKAGSTKMQVQGTLEKDSDFWFYVKGSGHKITISNLQIELGDTATEYNNFVAKQSYSIDDITMRCVDNVADTITVNKDGSGYFTQRINCVNLKEINKHQWNKTGNNVDRYYAPISLLYKIVDYSKLLCTHFVKKDNNDAEIIDRISSNSTNVGFAFAKKGTTTLNDWLNFIDNNDVILYYIMSEPIVTELTKEQIAKILAIRTNKTVTSAIANCDFQLEYVADTKSYIDNKFKELAQVIVASADESEVM